MNEAADRGDQAAREAWRRVVGFVPRQQGEDGDVLRAPRLPPAAA